MRSVFLSESMEKHVNEIHDSFAKIKAKDLLDYVIVPHKGQSEAVANNEHLHKQIRDVMLLPNISKFNQFGVFDMPTCTYMESRYKMIASMEADVKDILTKPISSVTVFNLERLSEYAHSPMQAFWIKHAAIELGVAKHYKGTQPYTKPVNKITKVFLGETVSQLRHTVFCAELASELGTYPSYINTAMWIMGERI